jgi:thiazole synthase ThiGH ThiG subunit
MENTFYASNLNFTRLWHCFGNSYHLAPFDIIIKMISASKTNVLPVNTHNLTKTNEDGLELGYAGVPLSKMKEVNDISDMHIMLNINLQTTAMDAVNKTKLAFDMTGEPLIKLEVLDKKHAKSNQEEIVKAVKELTKWNSSLKIYPLFANDLTTANKLIDAGSELLRVMGSPIGSCNGITDKKTFRDICSLGAPVVLDGGIGSLSDAKEALELGAEGFLVNSMLFEQKITPFELLGDFKLLVDNFQRSAN